MHRQNARQRSSLKSPDNPYKRRGPGAAHAAPLAYGSVLGKHDLLGDERQTPPVTITKPGKQRVARRTRKDDGAGPSSTVPQGRDGDGLQRDTFPRFRITSVRQPCSKVRKKVSNSEEDVFMKSSPASGGRSVSILEHPGDSSLSLLEDRDDVPAMPIIETVLARATPEVEVQPTVVGNANEVSQATTEATEAPSGVRLQLLPFDKFVLQLLCIRSQYGVPSGLDVQDASVTSYRVHHHHAKLEVVPCVVTHHLHTKPKWIFQSLT